MIKNILFHTFFFLSSRARTNLQDCARSVTSSHNPERWFGPDSNHCHPTVRPYNDVYRINLFLEKCENRVLIFRKLLNFAFFMMSSSQVANHTLDKALRHLVHTIQGIYNYQSNNLIRWWYPPDIENPEVPR